MTDIEQTLRAIVRDELAKARAEDQHITIAEYAKRWNISPSTVRAAIRDGRLAADRIGRAVRIAANAKIAGRSPRDPAERARLKLCGVR